VELKELDVRIAEARAESVRLTAAIEAANREEFPAEKVAREELNLVHPDDLVLLYPPGSVSGDRPTPVPTRLPRKTVTAVPSPSASSVIPSEARDLAPH
jgi:hypothetical protein